MEKPSSFIFRLLAYRTFLGLVFNTVLVSFFAGVIGGFLFFSSASDSVEVLGGTPDLSNLENFANVAGFVPDGAAEAVAPAVLFDREFILADSDSRISADFKIPAGLHDRVGFWFDVYSKYDSNQRIIHHALYPWIIFKIVDVTQIINSDYPRVRWLRNLKAESAVKNELAQIRAALKKLSHRKNAVPQNEYEQLVADALKPLGDDLTKLAKQASREVRMQMGQRDFFMGGLKASSKYLHDMEETFASFNLPTELARIPFVESSFNHEATSYVGASGIWQFMDSTGRNYMRVDGLIDERRSPLKATEGAARLLKENYQILYKSWPLAISAWNHGPGGIRKAAKIAGSKDLAIIVQKYRSRSFDFASSNFYSEFLAALHTEKYEKEIFGELEKELRNDLVAVKLPRRMKLSKLVNSIGLSMEEFVSCNPDLKRAVRANITLPAGFKLHLPASAKSAVDTLFADVTAKGRTASVQKPASGMAL